MIHIVERDLKRVSNNLAITQIYYIQFALLLLKYLQMTIKEQNRIVD